MAEELAVRVERVTAGPPRRERERCRAVCTICGWRSNWRRALEAAQDLADDHRCFSAKPVLYDLLMSGRASYPKQVMPWGRGTMAAAKSLINRGWARKVPAGVATPYVPAYDIVLTDAGLKIARAIHKREEALNGRA